jgi:pSer/pThr/pTyr-binding forkhead associated (FHA) protein
MTYILVGVIVILGVILITLIVGSSADSGSSGNAAEQNAPPPPPPEEPKAPAPGPITADGRTTVFSFPLLTVKDRMGIEKTYRLDFGDFNIGASKDSDLVLPGDEGIGEQQARITLNGTCYQIEDLGGGVGVIVNGEKSTSHALSDNDTLTIGKTVITVSGVSA